MVALTGAKIGIRGMRVNSGNTYMRLFMNHLMPYADSIDEMTPVGGGAGIHDCGLSILSALHQPLGAQGAEILRRDPEVGGDGAQ